MSVYAGNFDQIFLTRTRNILEEYTGEYEVTLLINTTLALICLPIETFKKNNTEVTDKVFTELKKYAVLNEIKNEDNVTEKLSFHILKCLRNGIAHLKIKPNKDGETFKTIEIQGDTFRHKIEYSFNFQEKELKEFCIKLTDIFLEYK